MIISVYITCANQREAAKIARALLTKRLIACANFWPVTSLYWWHGCLTRAKEFALLAKTIDTKFFAIEKEVQKLHSYQVPGIMAQKISHCSAAYSQWVSSEVIPKKLTSQ